MGVVGKFPSKYITAMSSGQALGGIFTALVEILSLSAAANQISSGLLYFTIGDAVLLLSLISYIFLEREVRNEKKLSSKITYSLFRSSKCIFWESTISCMTQFKGENELIKINHL